MALVTGAGRGLGRAVAERLSITGIHVVAGVRQLPAAPTTPGPWADLSERLTALELDVTDPAQVRRAHHAVQERFGRLDILINNAGVYHDHPELARAPLVEDLDPAVLQRTLAVNLYGPLLLTRAFLPGMRQRRHGRIVNVSSGRGRFGDLDATGAAYRLSKTALNALTRIVAVDTTGQGILVNAVCPGWVWTDMGGADAPRSVDVAAEGVCWAATLPPDGPTGGFLRDAKPLDWCLTAKTGVGCGP